MAPDLLIIGEAAEREDLSQRVEAFGYRSATASAGELARHLGEFPPAAILLCARGSEVRTLLSQLRQDPKGLGIPVILYSELGGEIRDLADVMELGADRFLVAPVDDDELRETTLELLGPSEPTALSPGLDTDAADLPLRRRDPLLAQLRRTLAALDERNEAPAGDSGEFDLDAIGLGGGPDLDAELDASASADDLALIDVEPVTQRVVRGQPRATTLRIADEAATSIVQRAPSRPAAARGPGRPPRPTAKTSALQERAATGSDRAGAATQRLGDRPRHTSRLRERERERPAELPSASERGALDDAPLPELLLRLQEERFSGHLRLRKSDAADEGWASGQDVDVLFSRGSPVEIHSGRPEDRLSEGLLRRGQIDAATARELRARLVKESRANVDTAIELGALKPSERSSALSEHIAELLTSAFTWSGTWSLHPAPELDAREPALDRPLAAIIAEGILLELETPVLRRRLGPGEARPRLRPGASTADLDPPVEARALGPALDGRLTLDDIAAAGGRPLLAWIYALRVLGRLELDGPELDPDGPQSPADGDADGNAAAIDLRRIRMSLGPARKGDYFALLDLPVGASRGELRRAHHKLRQTFADERLEASTRSAQATELRELRAALDEARDVLLDDALRAAYLAYREG